MVFLGGDVPRSCQCPTTVTLENSNVRTEPQPEGVKTETALPRVPSYHWRSVCALVWNSLVSKRRQRMIEISCPGYFLFYHENIF